TVGAGNSLTSVELTVREQKDHIRIQRECRLKGGFVTKIFLVNPRAGVAPKIGGHPTPDRLFVGPRGGCEKVFERAHALTELHDAEERGGIESVDERDHFLLNALDGDPSRLGFIDDRNGGVYDDDDALASILNS